MRDPSIHITKSKFIELLELLEIDNFPIDPFFTIARKSSIDSRVIFADSKKVTKQVDKITLANHGDAALASEILYAERIKLRHKGVRRITESNSRDWVNCKKLADICNTFCSDFGLETRQGFITYMDIGLNKLNGNFRSVIQKLITLSGDITLYYESDMYIRKYTRESRIKDEVNNIHDYYVQYIANHTGIYEDFKDKPDKYLHMCKLHELLASRHWDYQEFINAQFEALSFCNGVPSIESLYNDKAIERYNKYMFKTHGNKEQSDTPVIQGGLWSKIK